MMATVQKLKLEHQAQLDKKETDIDKLKNQIEQDNLRFKEVVRDIEKLEKAHRH